jgi:four helix bundle protein
MKDFRELKVWEKAHQLTLAVYQATTAFPKEELYGLTSQMRRSAASIPTNIAEGCGRGSDDDFRRFLQIAMGSASELEYHVLLAHDLGYLAAGDGDRLTAAIIEVKRMLASLITKIRNDR